MLVDLHHHLVYGVDDGSRSREMSQAMLARAAEQGVTHIACTSHTRPGEHDLNMDRYLRHIDTLRGMIGESGYDITLFTGCEIMYTSRTPRLLREGKVPTLGGTANVLVEFMPETPLEFIRRALMDTAEAGFHVVLAHAERYVCLHEGDVLAALKEETYPTIQMNADTVLRAKGLFGDRFARCLRFLFRDCGLVGAAVFVDERDGGTHVDHVALAGQVLADHSGDGAGEFNSGLVAHHFHERLIDCHRLAFLHEPLHDFAFDNGFCQFGQFEFSSHG